MAISHEAARQNFDNFEQLLDRARGGTQKDLGVLLDVYRSYLMNIASRGLSRGVMAKVAPSDIVQDTLMHASCSFARFQGSSEAELREWLRKILSRKVIDTHRHYKDYAIRDVSREVPFFQVSDQAGITVGRSVSKELADEVSEKSRVLAELLSQLSDDQRQAIQLRTFEKLTFEEVGKRLQRTTEAARKIWSRAIQQMSEEFHTHGF